MKSLVLIFVSVFAMASQAQENHFTVSKAEPNQTTQDSTHIFLPEEKYNNHFLGMLKSKLPVQEEAGTTYVEALKIPGIEEEVTLKVQEGLAEKKGDSLRSFQPFESDADKFKAMSMLSTNKKVAVTIVFEKDNENVIDTPEEVKAAEKFLEDLAFN